jgi:hypothetical protein
MRQLLAATAVEAKSIWIKCGGRPINLDSEKKRYSLMYCDGMTYQGRILYELDQIGFDFLPRKAIKCENNIN